MLVTERTPGLAASDLANLSRTQETATADRLSELGTTPAQLGRVLVSVALAQVVGQSSFQADYVPANIAVLPGGRISFLDFTQYVGHASSSAGDQLAYLTAVFDGDLAHMFPPTDREATSTEGDLADFRRALLRQVGPASAPPVGTGVGAASLAPPAQFLVDVLRMSGDFGVSLAVGSPTIYATVVAAVRTAQLFDEPGDTTRAAQAYLRVARIEAATETVSAAQLERVAASLLALWRDTPGQLHQLMSDLSEGTFALNVRTSTSRQSEEHQNRRTRLVAAAILSVSLAVVVAAPKMPRPGGVWLGWPVAAVLAGLYVWILVMWRRLR
jgi:predicted unusual protein kinase regulating ubiquinone biosynthesis (AarF/ABC1/UbiB family)